MVDTLNSKKDKSLEISVSDLVQFLRKYIPLIFLTSFCFAVIGVIYSFTLPKMFTSQTILLPEYSISPNNSFFNMAMGSERTGAEKLTPELYPNILSSTPFGKYLMMRPVTDQNGKKFATLQQFMRQDTVPTFMSRVLSFLRPKSKPQAAKMVEVDSSNIVVLSQSDQAAIYTAIGLVKISVDDKNGIIIIESEMEDPVVAAQVVEASKNYLIRYVEDYRTSKTSDQGKFLEKRAAEAKVRQRNAEFALQSYRDQNRNSFLNVARIEEQRLQAEYTLAQSIYSDLIIKLEQSKIKVKEELPVFKILEPAKVPLDKSSPKRSIIAFVFAVCGAFITLMYIVFVKEKFHLRLLEL